MKAEEIAAAAAGERRALEALAETWMPRLQRIARYLSSKTREGWWIEADDLIGWGWMGLIDALRLWAPEGGASFSTFATLKVRGRMLDEARSATKSRSWKRLGEAAPRFQHLGAMTYEDGESWEPADPTWNPEAIDDDIDGRSEAREHAREELRAALALIVGEREREVLVLHHVEGLPLRLVGERIGLTESRCSQLESRATRKIRRAFAHV